MLDPETLGRLLQKAERLGLTSLVEVHCASEIDSIRSLRPSLVGINSRNLKTFRIDRALPMMLAGLIDWNASLVFESGIQNEEDAAYAYHGGFSGILCGEALMKESSLAGKLVQLAGDFAASGEKASGSKYFWRKLYSGFGAGKNRLKPLVKICGIMEYNDAAAAASLGADMIGFVFADSKRRAEISLPEQLCSIDILKIAVVKNPDAALMDRLRELYEEGFIDAVQYHGKEEPSFCRDAGMPYYKAFSYASASAAPAVPSQRFSCPRFLTDSAADGKEGGTGQNVESSVVDIIRKREALWLAGGISDQNIAYIIDRFSPELVDASSRLEIYPGKKDLKKLENFFRQLNK
jgi:indole-3-glycerol phosphate synthase/phosphoribosylanthranilate isomerase